MGEIMDRIDYRKIRKIGASWIRVLNESVWKSPMLVNGITLLKLNPNISQKVEEPTKSDEYGK